MAIELTDDLINAQRASDAAHAEVLRLAEEYGPTIVDWTDEQRADRDQAYAVWRDRAAEVQAAVTEYAAEIDEPRNKVEQAVKVRVRHQEPADG
ncbi:hypothetical protein [Streptomyces sp. NPDC012888]|uniref:hypothetical protein n=1 Tax=Streptomyces sp. NPDC012888 TaxID=3364855 RepID=UPI003682EEAE